MAQRKKKKKRKSNYKGAPQNLSCPFDKESEKITYKDVYKLKKFVTTRGRMLTTEKTGVCPRCQRRLTKAIKRARYMALLPFTEYV